MKDQTIESLPIEERNAANSHLEWLTQEFGDRETAEEFLTQVLISMGPQARRDHS
jgi:hypothetical protein